MKVRFPLSAPGVEPVQGASSISTPFRLRIAPIFRLSLGLIVLASATTVPSRPPAPTPSGPRMTVRAICVSPTQRNTQSAFSATSFGVAQQSALLGLRQLACLFASVRPQGDLVPRAEQVARHRVTHQTESEESKSRHREDCTARVRRGS